jgi:proton glutamate symport protein
MRTVALALRILQDPKTIIGGGALGFASGFYLREFSHSLKPLADIYVSLLSMCLLPILVTALIWGISQMLRHPRTNELFGRMAVVYVIGLSIPAAVTILVALALAPGSSLGEDAAAALGGKLANAEMPRDQGGLLAFVQTVARPNVFQALSTGSFISIVFFCALAGLALGVVRSPGGHRRACVPSWYAGCA